MSPLLTSKVHDAMIAAVHNGVTTLTCSLDLDRSTTTIALDAARWHWGERSYPYLDICKERTIYHWAGESFEPVARFGGALIKLVPTSWGPPTFEIDGIKMLPTAQVSPYEDARRKVILVRPRGKVVLDTCGGLGYFAAWCLEEKAAAVLSYEKSADVLWLRTLNPWSPHAVGDPDHRLSLTHGDVVERIRELPARSVDAILHDPPRFGIAGELYSRDFYDQLARVLRPRGLLFHYTGSPNRLTSGRDVPNEVSNRLRAAGFSTSLRGDGVFASR